MSKHEQIEGTSTTYNMVNLMRLRNHLARLSDSKTEKKDLLKLKSFLDAVGFNMGSFYPMICKDKSPHNCGTSCCIAGHMILLDSEEGFYGGYGRAQELLGLSDHDATWLFYGTFKTLEHVIDVLDYMIHHGTIPPKPTLSSSNASWFRRLVSSPLS